MGRGEGATPCAASPPHPIPCRAVPIAHQSITPPPCTGIGTQSPFHRAEGPPPPHRTPQPQPQLATLLPQAARQRLRLPLPRGGGRTRWKPLGPLALNRWVPACLPAGLNINPIPEPGARPPRATADAPPPGAEVAAAQKGGAGAGHTGGHWAGKAAPGPGGCLPASHCLDSSGAITGSTALYVRACVCAHVSVCVCAHACMCVHVCACMRRSCFPAPPPRPALLAPPPTRCAVSKPALAPAMCASPRPVLDPRPSALHPALSSTLGPRPRRRCRRTMRCCRWTRPTTPWTTTARTTGRRLRSGRDPKACARADTTCGTARRGVARRPFSALSRAGGKCLCARVGNGGRAGGAAGRLCLRAMRLRCCAQSSGEQGRPGRNSTVPVTARNTHQEGACRGR